MVTHSCQWKQTEKQTRHVQGEKDQKDPLRTFLAVLIAKQQEVLCKLVNGPG